MKVRPLADRVLVEVLEAESKTKGGIILPDTAKEEKTEGKVIAVGPGALLDGAFDIVLGHAFAARSQHGGAQARVGGGIGHAHLGRHGDFAGKLGKQRAALFVLRTLAVHDVLEFAVTGH